MFGADAVRLINAHDAKVPLFLYLAFTAPHTPYQAPQNYLDMYKGITDPLRRTYAAQITAMDDEIGKVIDALERRNMRDNTLIYFVSDNGGTRSNLFVGEAEVKGPTRRKPAAFQRTRAAAARTKVMTHACRAALTARQLAMPSQWTRPRAILDSNAYVELQTSYEKASRTFRCADDVGSDIFIVSHNVAFWHEAELPECPLLRRCWRHIGRAAEIGPRPLMTDTVEKRFWPLARRRFSSRYVPTGNFDSRTRPFGF